MIKSIYQKGASFALGWSDLTYVPTVQNWYKIFLGACDDGSTIYQAMQQADRETSGVSLGRKIYYGNSGQYLKR